MGKYIEKFSKRDMPSLDALQKELKRERYNRRFRLLLRSTVNALIVVAAIAALVATLVLPVLQIAGTSMEPSLNDGNIVLLAKTNNLGTGDLCAFYYSNKILLKRIIATPGDYIWIESYGTVFLNGKALDEHVHGNPCAKGPLVCTLEAEEGHVHTESCLERMLVCQLEA